MKMKFFALMLSAAFFTTNPLFAMDPPPPLPENGLTNFVRANKDCFEIIEKFLYDKELMFFGATSKGMQQLCDPYLHLRGNNLPFKFLPKGSGKEQLQAIEKLLSLPQEYEVPLAFISYVSNLDKLLLTRGDGQHNWTKRENYWEILTPLGERRFNVRCHPVEDQIANIVDPMSKIIFKPQVEDGKLCFEAEFSFLTDQNRTKAHLINGQNVFEELYDNQLIIHNKPVAGFSYSYHYHFGPAKGFPTRNYNYKYLDSYNEFFSNSKNHYEIPGAFMEWVRQTEKYEQSCGPFTVNSFLLREEKWEICQNVPVKMCYGLFNEKIIFKPKDGFFQAFIFCVADIEGKRGLLMNLDEKFSFAKLRGGELFQTLANYAHEVLGVKWSSYQEFWNDKQYIWSDMDFTIAPYKVVKE